MKKSDVKFKKTCSACPEQYECYNSKTDEHIGYVRVRWGVIHVDYYGKNGTKVVLKESISDDEYAGSLIESQRVYYMDRIRTLLADSYNKEHPLKDRIKLRLIHFIESL